MQEKWLKVIIENNLHKVDELIKTGVNINDYIKYDNIKINALSYALFYKKYEICKLLINKGVDLDVVVFDYSGSASEVLLDIWNFKPDSMLGLLISFIDYKEAVDLIMQDDEYMILRDDIRIRRSESSTFSFDESLSDVAAPAPAADGSGAASAPAPDSID